MPDGVGTDEDVPEGWVEESDMPDVRTHEEVLEGWVEEHHNP